MDLKQVNDTLNTYIRPQTFPIAIKLFTAQEALPAKAKIPVKDLGYQVALCQAWAFPGDMAGRWPSAKKISVVLAATLPWGL